MLNPLFAAVLLVAAEGAAAPPAEVPAREEPQSLSEELLGAPSQADQAREVDIFGGDEASEALDASGAPQEPATADDEKIDGTGARLPGTPGDPATAGAMLDGKLKARHDPLAIGAWLYMRGDGAYTDRQRFSDLSLTSPNLLDVYLDGRPSQRLRAYARGRLAYDPTVQPGTVDTFGAARKQQSVLLDQLWLKFDIANRVFFTIGKQTVRWGSNRFWNPTDVLNSTFRAALDVVDTRLGVGLLKMHLPLELLGWNFYGILAFEGAKAMGDLGGAVRGEFLVKTTEIALMVSKLADRPWQLGLDISSGFWWFDLHAEAVVMAGVDTPFFSGSADLQNLVFPTTYRRKNDIIPRTTVGLELTVPYGNGDSLIFGAEYFFNDAGVASPSYYPFMIAANTFVSRYAARHYAAAYISALAPGSWENTTFSMAAVGNLSDQTLIVRFDAGIRVLTYLALNAYVMGNLGQRGGEFRFAVDLPPNFLPQLPNGLKVEPLSVIAGVGFRLTI